MILIYLLLMNIAGFVMMGLDKRFSKIQGKRRIPERTLLTTAFIGGALGSYIGMKLFHHKTLHSKFRYGIPAIIVVHILLVLFFLTKTEFSIPYFP